MKNIIEDDVERLIDNNRSSVLAFAYNNKDRYLSDFIEMLSFLIIMIVCSIEKLLVN